MVVKLAKTLIHLKISGYFLIPLFDSRMCIYFAKNFFTPIIVFVIKGPGIA